MDALEATGAGADDPAVKNALIFVSRCQNLESEYNTTPFAAKLNDGGFYYTPAAGGASMAAAPASGPERRLGELWLDDLRGSQEHGLRRAHGKRSARQSGRRLGQEQLRSDLQPGHGARRGDAGLFYYYVTFAKAFEALGQETIEDAKGAKHDWRQELVDELAKRQQPDGSWVNENKRFMESNPILVTGYSLTALTHCKPQK